MLDPKYWPAVFYGPDGQDQVFESPDQVPEGWHDDPAKVGDPEAVTVVQGLEEMLAATNLASVEGEGEGSGGKNVDVPEYNDITVSEIKTLLDGYEVEYDDNDRKPDLYAKLKAAMEAAE